ncbi:hypothetical protein G7Y89_g14747 [Cudoniella acicularis]|uniref:Uncharacterized protein n=1 Tax=Cudoniella acicularis TaxID=354080 RepID=A0A8H4QYP1_9HELO|nr:hypothetical protein G7Y89_g14747 [Cudoniella acicularis]
MCCCCCRKKKSRRGDNKIPRQDNSTIGPKPYDADPQLLEEGQNVQAAQPEASDERGGGESRDTEYSIAELRAGYEELSVRRELGLRHRKFGILKGLNGFECV